MHGMRYDNILYNVTLLHMAVRTSVQLFGSRMDVRTPYIVIKQIDLLYRLPLLYIDTKCYFYANLGELHLLHFITSVLFSMVSVKW